jgi:hypothetical protein
MARVLNHRGSLLTFATGCGVCLMVQSRLTLTILATALPNDDHSILAMRFRHPCMPLMPNDTLTPFIISLVQAGAGAGLSASAILCMLRRCRTTTAALRVSALAGSASILYLLLVEASVYQNHHYLFLHVLLCLGVVPHHGQLRALLRFLTSLPYAYGALAKLTSPDWVGRHQPAHQWCHRELLATLPAWLSPHAVAQPARCAALLSIGGIVVDALIVPLLALPPPRSWLRLLGVTLGICFHLTNACLFHIGIFPWLMLMSLVLWRTEDGEG